MVKQRELSGLSSGLAKMILQDTLEVKLMSSRDRRGWKTILKNGQRWTLSAQPGQLKIEKKDKKGLLRGHLWRSNALATFVI